MIRVVRVLALLCMALGGFGSGAVAQTPWSLKIDAASFSRSSLFDAYGAGPAPANARRVSDIKKNHCLAGEGWVEYDFSLPEDGWYTIGLPAALAVSDHDFYVDGAVHVYGGVTGRITNAFLRAGAHTLRVQRFTELGLAGISSFTVKRSGPAVGDTVRVQIANASLVLRKSEPLRLDITSGGRTLPDQLTIWVKDSGTGSVIKTVRVSLPAAPRPVVLHTVIPNQAEGLYYLSFGDRSGPIDPTVLREVEYVVIDTSSQPSTSGDLRKTLLKEIDCGKQAPDYQRGETSIVHSPFGDYRESTDRGYLQSPKDFGFFAYHLDVPEAQQPYLVQVDYPDDDLRTYLVALMERNMMDYPPVGGVDTGGIYPISESMQTQSYIYYPRGKDVVVSFVNARDTRRAAGARIRLYRIDGSLPALKVPPGGGRSFGYWLEEGDRWATFSGAPDKTLSGYLISMNRWAETARYMGVDTLMPTIAIYQNVLYPTQFYNGYFRPSSGPRDPMSPDIVRMLLLVCEKHGLKLLPEFHPSWNAYKRIMVDDAPYATDPDPKPQLLVGRDGQIGRGSFQPYLNPFYPANQAWYIGMLGEFADRYRDSPALAGVSLRLSAWVWESRNGLPSLNWGYEDYTVHLFEHDCGLSIPVADSDPARFRKRYDWIMAHARTRWIDWRCDKVAQLYGKICGRIRQARPDLLVVVPVLGQLDLTYHNEAVRFTDTDDYRQFYKESGFDMTRLGRIPNLVFLNGLYAYGRRLSSDIADQAVFDFLYNPAARLAFVGPTGRTGSMFSNQYFEADQIIDPAVMGFDGVKPQGWVGVANPAGRQYLQRYALSLADGDSSMIMDGGEGYLHGQPLLREFLANYRALPATRFTPRQDARDPVAVWEYYDGKHFWFYAVSRDAFPSVLTLKLKGTGKVTRVASGATVNVADQVARITVQPYELAAFECQPTRSIVAVSTSIAPEALARAQRQAAWISRIADVVSGGGQGVDLSPDSKAFLVQTASQVRKELAQGHVWRVWSLVINHRLRAIYDALGTTPPDVNHWKAPPMPIDAVAAQALAAQASAAPGYTVQTNPSDQVDPQWVGSTVLTTISKQLMIKFNAPVANRYRLEIGQVEGGRYGPLAASIDGVSIGLSGAAAASGHAAIGDFPPIVLSQGDHTLDLDRTSGSATAVNWLKVTPAYTDIVCSDWSTIGSFPSPSDGNGPGPGFSTALAPELTRDFDRPIGLGDGTSATWMKGEGSGDYFDLFDRYHVEGNGVAYAVTYIYAPTNRQARISYDVDWWAKLWLNGDQLADFTTTRPQKAADGRFQLDVSLKQGWNELLLKIQSGTAGNGFWARISDPGDLRFAPTTSDRITAKVP